MSSYSLLVLRLTFSALFYWFGIEQLTEAEEWVGFLPDWIGYLPIPGEMLVQLNGLFEVVCATALLIGVYTRWIAGFLAIHLFGIALSAGGAIGVCYAALGMMGVVLAMSESDPWTLDTKAK